MKISPPPISTDGVNSPKIEFKGTAHQVKKLLDELQKLSLESIAHQSSAPKFINQVPSQMKKLDIF